MLRQLQSCHLQRLKTRFVGIPHPQDRAGSQPFLWPVHSRRNCSKRSAFCWLSFLPASSTTLPTGWFTVLPSDSVSLFPKTSSMASGPEWLWTPCQWSFSPWSGGHCCRPAFTRFAARYSEGFWDVQSSAAGNWSGLGRSHLASRQPSRFTAFGISHSRWSDRSAADGSPRSWLIALPALYLLYGATLAAFLLWEHHILKTQLAEEVSLQLAPEWVLDIIPYYRRRVRSGWWPSRNERTVLSRLLTRIAFRKHAVRHLPPDEAAIASLEVVQLRQRLRMILAPGPEDTE